MRTIRWMATAAPAALALAVTAVVPLPAVLAVLRREKPPATEGSGGAQDFFHESTPEEAIQYALALDDADLLWAIERAGLGGRIDPGTLRRGLRARAWRPVSCVLPPASGEDREVRRWRVGSASWDLEVVLSLPSGPERKTAKSLAERGRTRVATRTLRWLRERSLLPDCMVGPLAWLQQDLDESERAAEVLACFRAFRTPEEKAHFLGAAATQAGLRLREEAEWAGAWRKPVDPAWLAAQERAIARLAGE